MKQLKVKVGQTKFDKLNEEFNKKWTEFIKQTRASNEYKKMNNDEKIAYVRTKKQEIKKEVLKKSKR